MSNNNNNNNSNNNMTVKDSVTRLLAQQSIQNTQWKEYLKQQECH